MQTVLLLSTANAMSTVLQVQKTCPTDTATRDLAEGIYDDLRRSHRESASRAAVVNWFVVELRKLSEVDITGAYSLLFRGRVRVKPPPPSAEDPSVTASMLEEDSVLTAEPEVKQKVRLSGAPPTEPETVSPRPASAPVAVRDASFDKGVLEVFSVEIRTLEDTGSVLLM
jgi:hypothetical protein